MMMAMFCLDVLKVQGWGQAQVSIELLEVLNFISTGFVPMDEKCDRAGLSERQIFGRTKAVVEYFDLPCEEELTCC